MSLIRENSIEPRHLPKLCQKGHRIGKWGLALSLLLILIPSTLATAQEATPTPTPSTADEIKRLQEEIDLINKRAEKAAAEKKLAEATATKSDKEKKLEEEIELAKKRTEKAEADKKLLEAFLPSAQTKPLEGKVTLDDKAIFESEMLSNRAMTELANKMAGDIKKDLEGYNKKSIVVFSRADVNSVQYYNVITKEITAVKGRYENLLSAGNQELGAASFLLAPDIASSLLKSTADLLGLFRTDTDVKGLNFTIDEAAAVSRLAKGLKGISVYYPTIYPPNLFTPPKSVLMENLGKLLEEKGNAEAVIARCEKPAPPPKTELAKLEERIEILKRKIEIAEAEKKLAAIAGNLQGAGTPDPPQGSTQPGGTPSPVVTCQASLKANVPKLKALNEQVDKFFGDLLKVDDKVNASPLSLLLQAENLVDVSKNDGTFFLQLVVQKAAGSNITKKNIFTGTRVYHSGGAIAYYNLFDKNGPIQSSNTDNKYHGLVQIKSRTETLDDDLKPKQ